jgi:branched-subunit amino acid permease
VGAIEASIAMPVAMTNSTARLLIVGSTPGSPRQTGQQWEFGAAPSMSVEQPQNILLTVFSWQWISMPMTAS